MAMLRMRGAGNAVNDEGGSAEGDERVEKEGVEEERVTDHIEITIRRVTMTSATPRRMWMRTCMEGSSV
eukprot:6917236-Pyramimonas_sp.AAC.1